MHFVWKSVIPDPLATSPVILPVERPMSKRSAGSLVAAPAAARPSTLSSLQLCRPRKTVPENDAWQLGYPQIHWFIVMFLIETSIYGEIHRSQTHLYHPVSMYIYIYICMCVYKYTYFINTCTHTNYNATITIINIEDIHIKSTKTHLPILINDKT